MIKNLSNEKINALLEKMDLGCLKKESYTLIDIDVIKFILEYSFLDDKENMQLFNEGCLRMAASIIDDLNKWYGRYFKLNSAVNLVDKIKYDGIKEFDNIDTERLVFLNMLSDEIKREIVMCKYDNDDFLSKMFFDINNLISDVMKKKKFENYNYLLNDKFNFYLDVRFANPFFDTMDCKKKIKFM